MGSFMVLATFTPDTVMDDVIAVVAEEQAQVKELTDEGRLGPIHISLARGAVFLEVFADDAAGAEATVRTLPMSRGWDLDTYALAPPVAPGAAPGSDPAPSVSDRSTAPRGAGGGIF